LGMILHKLIFFKLPYRYAADGDASANSDSDKMKKLEREVLSYAGFRATSSVATSFDSRHLPRAFLVLLENLLHVIPSSRPSCERVLAALREGRFDPVAFISNPVKGSLVPIIRQPGADTETTDLNDDSVTSSEALLTADGPEEMDTTVDSFPDSQASSKLEEKDAAFLRARRTVSHKVADSWAGRTAVLHSTVTSAALWRRTFKSCVLLCKVVSVMSLCPSRMNLVVYYVLFVMAVMDSVFDGLFISASLGFLHVVILWCGGCSFNGF